MNLDDIKTVFVHWSESELINREMGHDENYDIEKEIDPYVFDDMIKRAAKEVEIGYDKTVLTVTLNDDTVWCDRVKFYLTKTETGLISFLR